MEVPDPLGYLILIWTAITIVLWIYLLKKAIPGTGKAIEKKIKEGAKALLDDAETRFGTKIDDLKKEFKDAMPDIPAMEMRIQTNINATIEHIKTHTEGMKADVKEQIDTTINDVYSNITEIANGFIKRFGDPEDEEIRELVFYAVTRAWTVLIQNEDMQNRLKGFMDRKIDYLTDHFIKRLKEDPEFKKEVMGVVKSGAADMGFDIDDPFASFMRYIPGMGGK